MAEEVKDPSTTTTTTLPAWTEGLNDEQKSFVQEKGFREIGDILSAIPKSDAWTTSLNETQKGLVESKGFSSLGAVVDAYQNLEKLKGVPEDRLVKLPEKSIDEDAEGWMGVFNRLGRPEKAEEYDFKLPEGEGNAADQKTVEWAKNTFHSLGLTKKQAEGFINKWNEHAGSISAEMQEQATLKAQEAERELKNKWGMAYTKNKEVAENAAKQFGVDANSFSQLASVLGVAKTAEFFYNIGQSVGEGSFVSGDVAAKGIKTPSAAQYELSELQNDSEFIRKFSQGDREAKEKWDRLHQMAYPSS